MSERYLHAGVLAAVVVTAAVFAGVTTAASSASIEASPDGPGETATHTASVVVDGNAVGGSWSSFQVEYQATDVSNIGQNDVTKIGIDRDDDASGDTIDVDVSDDLSSVGADNNGHTLDVGLGGNYNLQQNDELVVVYENAQNPSAGDYDVTLHVNYQSADETATGTLSITSDTTTTSTPTTTQTPTATTTTQTPTTTTTTSDDDHWSSGGGISDVNEARAFVESNPDTANATATHVVGTVVESEIGDSSWSGLKVDYSGTGVDVSNVDQNDVVRVGIDRGNDSANGTIDHDYSASLGEVSGSNDGETLTFGFDGDYDLQSGDQIIVVYEDVQNPAPENYSVSMNINPESSEHTVDASLSVEAANTATATSTAEPTSTSAETTAATQTDAPTTEQTTAESTPTSSPGFGTVAAVVALAGAALLARR